jgi:dipeptidyl aminopeptidase/acylaminoacyl peptidase
VTSFADLNDYVAIPRVTALRLSPDGTWLAAAVQTASGQPNKYVTSIWRLSPRGDDSPARLTRSAEGEGEPEFLPDGSLLFTSKRPDPVAAKPDADRDTEPGKPALWLLPAAGGEPRRIVAPPGGVTAVAAAHAATRSGAVAVVIAAPVLTSTSAGEEETTRRKARKDAGVSAILHEAGPLRHWDHDLGPDSPRLLAAEIGEAADEEPATRDLTPTPGRALDDKSFEVTPDGGQVVTAWSVWDATGSSTDEIHVIDIATGQRRVLLAAPGYDFSEPRISPNGRLVVSKQAAQDSYAAPGDVTLALIPLCGAGEPDGGPSEPDAGPGEPDGGPRDLLAGLDRRPLETAWSPDSESVYFTADDQGRCPVYRADLATGTITKLTHDDGAYDNLCPAPDGRYLYALRSAVNEPPTPVRLDTSAPTLTGSAPDRLACPGTPLEVPGRLEEIFATADDGARIRAWLVLPYAATPAEPAPLLLWVHGGPVMSWDSWSWRWNPWLMAARGYAVLLPDPALSTGYGQDFIARGHGRWGERPYTDLMAITDVAVARPDIDEARTAMMGGSFGGYMANWIAGHTGRFRAIVSHAGLWALDQMFGTTDLPAHWRRMFGNPLTQPERYVASSPDRHAAQISTPMLVIHGDKDYRVPVGEALRLWSDLQSAVSTVSAVREVKFLYFPDENHWILTPGNAIVWYQTVLAFLAQHVLGEPWQRPELL